MNFRVTSFAYNNIFYHKFNSFSIVLNIDNKKTRIKANKKLR